MEFVSSLGEIDSLRSGAALCEPNSRLSAYVSARELEPVGIVQQLIDKGCTVEMAYQLAMAYYQRGRVGDTQEKAEASVSGVTSSARSVRSEKFFSECDNWLNRPGYCYTAMVRPSRRAAIAQMVGEFPDLHRIMRIPAGDVAWRRLSEIRIVQIAPITMHMQFEPSESGYNFINQVAALVKKFPAFASQEWQDAVLDVVPDEECFIGMATRFGVKTKGGDTLLDFSDYAKLVPTSEVHNPVCVCIDNVIDGSVDVDQVAHVGSETELNVRDDVMMVYRFEEPRVVWLTPRIVIQTQEGMTYGSDRHNVWLLVSGDLRCKISGAKGILRLGSYQDYGVADRFEKLRDLSIAIVIASETSVRIRSEVTVMSVVDMHKLGIRGPIVSLEHIAILAIGSVSNYLWEVEEIGLALCDTVELSGVQVTLMAWQQFLEDMDIVSDRADVANQRAVLQSAYYDAKGFVLNAISARTDYRNYEGVVVVSHEGHVKAASREYPKATVLSLDRAIVLDLDVALLRLYRSDRDKLFERRMIGAPFIRGRLLVVASYRLNL